MAKDLANFTTNLYLNFWNKNCHPILRPFIQKYLPHLLEDNIVYTGYLEEDTFAEREYQSDVQTIQFEKHPFFSSNYQFVVFQCFRKMDQGKCVGLVTAQVCFYYETAKDLAVATDELKSICLQLDSSIEIVENETLISIETKHATAYFKIALDDTIQTYSITFSGVSTFF